MADIQISPSILIALFHGKRKLPVFSDLSQFDVDGVSLRKASLLGRLESLFILARVFYLPDMDQSVFVIAFFFNSNEKAKLFN
jgi:hypothetical protein